MHPSTRKFPHRARTLAGFVLLLAGVAAADPGLDGVFDRDVLVVAANDHACYRFDIYLATTDMQRAQGLMFVRELPATTGMLFIYDQDAYLSMWMKNTYIPLDMLFVRVDGNVASVATDTEPRSLRSVAAQEPVRYVLELNAGVTAALGIGPDAHLYIDHIDAARK